jgi:hypothetical protein
MIGRALLLVPGELEERGSGSSRVGRSEGSGAGSQSPMTSIASPYEYSLYLSATASWYARMVRS